MTDLNALVIFAKVAETGSFSEAARRLNTPISTVSRKVAVLEDDLGVGLLERSTRSLRLTDVGEYAQAEHLSAGSLTFFRRYYSGLARQKRSASESIGDGINDADIVLASGRDVRTNSTEGLCAGLRAKGAGDFLF